MAEDTRDRIVDAAERLFAERGVERTSLRAVTRAAGVNVAAIHYHFGSREELLRAVLDKTVRPLNARRLVLLEQALQRSDGALAVRDILDAFLRPDVEAIETLRERDVEIARFLGRLYAAPAPTVERIMGEQFRTVSERFLTELRRSLPGVRATDIEYTLRLVVGVVVALFTNATPAGEPGPLDTTDVDATVDRLADFLVPGFAALKGGAVAAG
jgi:AcrR family transcriptional regulator